VVATYLVTSAEEKVHFLEVTRIDAPGRLLVMRCVHFCVVGVSGSLGGVSGFSMDLSPCSAVLLSPLIGLVVAGLVVEFLSSRLDSSGLFTVDCGSSAA